MNLNDQKPAASFLRRYSLALLAVACLVRFGFPAFIEQRDAKRAKEMEALGRSMDSTQPISAQDLQTITALIPLSPGETIADTQRFGGTAFVSTINRVAGWAAQYVFEEGQGWQLKGTGLSPISSFPFHYVHVPSSLSKEDVKQIIEAVPKSAYGDVLRITAPSNGVVRVASGIGQFFGPFSELQIEKVDGNWTNTGVLMQGYR